MSNDNMGNLEKLGILVIVILVVVVGVVAITPEQTLFPDDGGGGTDIADLDEANRGGSDRVGSELDAVNRGREFEEALPQIGGQQQPVKPQAIWPTPPTPQTESIPDPIPAPEPPKVILPEPPTPTPAPAPTPPAPTFREYKVAAGDSFYRIAERELGNVALAKQIQAANPGVDPRRLQLGQALRLPLGSSVGTVGISRSPDASLDRGSIAEPRSSGRSYVVKSGDTPMDISNSLWGTVTHWRTLLDHNGISDPGALHIGTVLRVPDIAAAAAPSDARETHADVAPSRGASTGRAYTVKKGDTLIRIAERELNAPRRWREIMELNGISDPSELRTDAKIQLPAR